MGNISAHAKVETANKDNTDTVVQFSEYLIARLYGNFKDVNMKKYY